MDDPGMKWHDWVLWAVAVLGFGFGVVNFIVARLAGRVTLRVFFYDNLDQYTTVTELAPCVRVVNQGASPVEILEAGLTKDGSFFTMNQLAPPARIDFPKIINQKTKADFVLLHSYTTKELSDEGSRPYVKTSCGKTVVGRPIKM